MPRRSRGPRAASVPPGSGGARTGRNHRRSSASPSIRGSESSPEFPRRHRISWTTEGKCCAPSSGGGSPFEWQRTKLPALLSTRGTLAGQRRCQRDRQPLGHRQRRITARLHRTGRQRRQYGVSPDQALAGQRRRRWHGKSWILPTANCSAHFAGRAPSRSGCFDPTGRTLARGSTDETVILWDTTNGALPVCSKNRSPVCSVGFETSG